MRSRDFPSAYADRVFSGLPPVEVMTVFVLPILLLLLVPMLGLAFVALVAMRPAPRRVVRRLRKD